ncbi:MAG: cytochrome P450 [Dehalococcoidia bacterium]|nr:cytochrome P450 [Dehalococcoidia bacterium]
MTTAAVFNPFVPSFKRNPYLQYGRLRQSDPVHRSLALQSWVLTRYDDILAVVRDHETFSSDSRHARGQLADALQQQRRESPLPDADTILGLDPPRHTQMRAIVSRAFTPRRVQELRPHIQEIAAGLLDEAGDRFDLMTDLAQPLPVIVIAELLGVSPDDRLQFKAWSNAVAETTNVMQSAETVRAARRATEELIEYFNRVIDARQANPTDDLISALVTAEVDGARLSRPDLLAFSILLLIAGNETTTNLIGNGLAALLEAPEAMARLRAEPDGIPTAVEEMLRYDSPVQGLVRFAARDVEVRGRQIAAGDVVLCMLGAANRDPEAFERADEFDITREENRHLSFGQGVHYCLGAPLARLEADVVFRTLLGRTSDIGMGEGGLERGGTMLLRGPAAFPVVVQPA